MYYMYTMYEYVYYVYVCERKVKIQSKKRSTPAGFEPALPKKTDVKQGS